MRSLPSDISGLPALITIQKALETIRFSTADRPVIVDGILWEPGPGADLTGLQFPSDGSPANADVLIMVQEGGIVSPGDVVRGEFDDWPITIALFDPNNLAAGSYPVLSGTIGSVEDVNGMATIAANGQLRQMQQRPLCVHYQLTCEHDLGDDGCKIPLCLEQEIGAFDIGRGQVFVRPDVATGLLAVSDAYGRVRTGVAGTVEDYANVVFEVTTPGTTHATTAPTYDPTIGNSTTDGTVVLIARNGWSRYARGHATDPYHIVLDALPDARASAASWYVYGGIFQRSGALSGFPKNVIMEWTPATLTLRLGLPMSVTDVPAGTQFEIHPGCDLTREMCASRFLNSVNPTGTNIENNFAFNFVPPPEFQFGG